jgi:uracil-DNA glycosylase family 4
MVEKPEGFQPKHPEARCWECPLAEGTAFVPTSFPKGESNGIAVVGEAPGFQESTYGVPFKGPSGQLLNQVLSHHGIDRSQTLLTNACLCRPEDNATPPKTAIAACRPRLLAELVDTKKVLTLGTPAAQSVLNTTRGVLALRAGPAKELNGWKVVPTVHPAYCLRQGDAFPSLVNDTAKLMLDPPVWEAPKWKLVDTEEEALQAIEQLHEVANQLVVDIETGIDKDNSFDHPNHYEMLCIGVGYAKGRVCVFGENSLTPTVYSALRELFKAKPLCAQNGKFDLAGLYPVLGVLKLWFDTMLAHYSLDERPGGHGLKYLGKEILGCPDWENEIARYLGPEKNYSVIPRPVLYRYNAYDVAVTWDLMEYFESELERTGQRRLHDFLVEASNELMFLELNGIAIDREYNKKLNTEYQERLYQMEQSLNYHLEGKDYDPRLGGINPRSPKQVKQYLHDNGAEVEKTDKETLKALRDKLGRFQKTNSSLYKFVDGLLEHRREAKEFGTYVKGITKRLYGGRVFTNYLLHGTTSGRLASRNPNLQNIVRNNAIRAQFVPSKPDNVFIQADYKQVEGRVLATLGRDEYLRNIFADPDRDLFEELGFGLYGHYGLHKEERIRVKAYFYGIGYGREAYSVATEYKLPLAETEEGLKQFKALIPGVIDYQQQTIKEVLSGQPLTTSFGRKRRFFLITKENKKDVINEALSFRPQSIASDICLSALIRLRPMLRGLGFIRLTIHDALVVECPRANVDEVSRLLRTVMVACGSEWTDYVPFSVDISVGNSWGELN